MIGRQRIIVRAGAGKKFKVLFPNCNIQWVTMITNKFIIRRGDELLKHVCTRKEHH